MHKLASVISAMILWSCHVKAEKTKLEEARKYLAYLDKEVCKYQHETNVANFNYYINSTDENMEKMNEAMRTYDIKYIKFDWQCFNEPDLLRQAKLYSLLDKNPPRELSRSMNNILSQMVAAGNPQLNFCSYKNRSICGDEGYLASDDANYNSNDTKEILYYWKLNHDSVGLAVRPLYESYINISKFIAEAQGFENKAEQWMSVFESPPVEKFEGVIMDFWNQIKPLYMQYHAFKRNKLRSIFGVEAVPKTGPIPGHLFRLQGREDFKPFPGKPSTNVRLALRKQNYTVMEMVEQVKDYYESMGLGVLPTSFYEQSMFIKPKDRPAICNPASFDFYNKTDFRIALCAKLDDDSFDSLVHEMGHIYNFDGYKDQPCCYRGGESPGIAEGVADTIGLSFMSYKHLTKLGLLDDFDSIDPEVIMNSLFFEASSKLDTIPFSILTDVWRWNLFRGNICPEYINAEYWNYKLQFEGTIQPENRSEEYLDIAGTIQILYDSQTISYFFSYLISFQFHEALCIAAKQYDPKDPTANPLYNCDLYGNKDAGTLLKKMYVLGGSKSWPAFMEAVTGQPNIDAGPFLRYFQSLYDWLVKENEKNGEPIGWD